MHMLKPKINVVIGLLFDKLDIILTLFQQYKKTYVSQVSDLFTVTLPGVATPSM